MMCSSVRQSAEPQYMHLPKGGYFSAFHWITTADAFPLIAPLTADCTPRSLNGAVARCAMCDPFTAGDQSCERSILLSILLRQDEDLPGLGIGATVKSPFSKNPIHTIGRSCLDKVI